jgi:membrane associated rhomboid family serine protease
MFVPLRDENPTVRAPIVNYALIGLNALVFVAVTLGHGVGVSWVEPGDGLVPRRLEADPVGEAFTLVTSQFLHAGWLHFGSNMLALHIFGDNLEDVLGRRRYLFFYLLGGALAALAHFASDMGSRIPMVGASGAIAAEIGGYVLLFPRAPVLALNLAIPLWFLGLVLVIPAWWVAAEFFMINALPALLDATGGGVTGGVAIYAHLGGLLAGVILIKPLLGGRRPEPRRFQGFRSSPRRAPEAVGARWRRRRRPRPSDPD